MNCFKRSFLDSPLIFIRFWIFLMCLATGNEFAIAAPLDDITVQGSISITHSPPVIRVVQQTEDAVVRWRSLNLAVGERLEVVQPSKRSRLFIQVTTGGLSDIRGNIESNGQIIIINPRGIHHQRAAHSRVGGLILSGLDLDLSGGLGKAVKFVNDDPSIMGNITNFGTIETMEGGNAALVGRWVINSGLIKGELSSVALAVGRGAHIHFENNGLINLNITKEEPKVSGADILPLGNLGEIIAPSGRIFITGSLSSRAFKSPKTPTTVASDSEITLAPGSKFRLGVGTRFLNRGLIDAGNPYDDREPRRYGGRIVIIADTIESSGPISAATLHESVAGQVAIAAADTVKLTDGGNLAVDADHYAAGGAVTILGKNIVIQDVSISANEGGRIRIGGKGTSPPSQLSATETIRAVSDINSYSDYSLGTIRFWAKSAVDISGSIMGSSDEGVDVSVISGGKLRFNSSVDIATGSRNPQRHGSLHLEARDILVAPNEGAWTVNSLKLDQALDAAHVTLRAGRDLVFTGTPSPLVLSDESLDDGYLSSLTLRAGNNVRLDNVGVFGLGKTTFHAHNDIKISNFTAIGRSGVGRNCGISAKRNIYLTDSLFTDSCNPNIRNDVVAGRKVHISNTHFKSLGD